MSIANLQSWEFPALNVTNLNITNTLTVAGTSTLHNTNIIGDLQVSNDIIGSGDLFITGASALHDTNIDGNLVVNGTTALDDTTIDGNLVVNGTIEIDAPGDLTMNGHGAMSSLNVIGEITSNSLSVVGDSFVGGNSTVQGILTIPTGGEIWFPPVATAVNDPLIITESYAFDDFNSAYTGAVIIANAINVKYFRFGKYVNICCTQIIADQVATSTAPISLVTAVPVELRPTEDVYVNCIIRDGLDLFLNGRAIITTAGIIGFGNMDTLDFSDTELSGLNGVLTFQYIL